MDVLGIGANMVKSLRYWLQATGLTVEPASGRKFQTMTPFGKIIQEYDPYFDEIGSLWLLHYQLAKNSKNATAWYFFFNEFNLSEFTREDYIKQVQNYLKRNGYSVSLRSLEDDFNCIINTYVSRIRMNPGKMDPESNIDCPLGELGLIEIANKSKRLFRKRAATLESLHPLIVMSVILDQAKGSKQVRLSSLQGDSCNIGRIFNLDVNTLNALLHKNELMGNMKVTRTAGLDTMHILKEMTFEDCVSEYFQSINS